MLIGTKSGILTAPERARCAVLSEGGNARKFPIDLTNRPLFSMSCVTFYFLDVAIDWVIWRDGFRGEGRDDLSDARLGWDDPLALIT